MSNNARIDQLQHHLDALVEVFGKNCTLDYIAMTLRDVDKFNKVLSDDPDYKRWLNRLIHGKIE